MLLFRWLSIALVAYFLTLFITVMKKYLEMFSAVQMRQGLKLRTQDYSTTVE